MSETSYYLVSRTPKSLDLALKIVAAEKGRLRHRVSPRLAVVGFGSKSRNIGKSLPRDVSIYREQTDARRALGKLQVLEKAVLTVRPPKPSEPRGWEERGLYGCSVD